MDYIVDFSVNPGKNCKENYKKCGIFNKNWVILCLPKEQECPLNGFGISNNSLEPNYDNTYQRVEVSDIITNKKYYFFYTNKNFHF